MFSSSIFRANDIRGVYNRDFDREFCVYLARGLRVLLNPSPKVLVGQDARLSSPELAETLISALKKEGIFTARAGLSPSPLCYFLLCHYRLSATVIVTASHNPKDYNGFKIMTHPNLQISNPIERLKEILSQPSDQKEGNEFPTLSETIPSLSFPFSQQTHPANQPFPKALRTALKKWIPFKRCFEGKISERRSYEEMKQAEKTPSKFQSGRLTDVRQGGGDENPKTNRYIPSGSGENKPTGEIAKGRNFSADCSFPFRSRSAGEIAKNHSFSVDIHTPYIQSLKKEFSLKPLPFVVDGGNGALGPLAKKVFKALRLSPSYLFCDPDGRFPNHHPDPTVEGNLSRLKQKVLETNSLFGVGWDGDGDRIGVVTGNGRFLFGDELGFLFVPAVLKQKSPWNRSKKIIADVKCSNGFLERIKKMGGEMILSKSGHRFARQALSAHHALFAMEFSGHIFFNDRPGRGFDDALYATLRLIELLNKAPDIESLLPPLNPFKTNEIRMPFPLKQITLLLNRVKAYLQKKGESFNSLDGVRINRGAAWALFRDSKTQNVLSIRFEASSKKELKLLREEFSQVMEIEIPEN